MMEPYYVVTRFEVDMGSDRQCRRLTSQVMGDGWMPAAAAGTSICSANEFALMHRRSIGQPAGGPHGPKLEAHY
jgi:hypothetical protein